MRTHIVEKIIKTGQHCALCYNFKIAPKKVYRKKYDNKDIQACSKKYRYVIYCKFDLLPRSFYVLRGRNSILNRLLNKKCLQYYAKPAETPEDLAKIQKLAEDMLSLS